MSDALPDRDATIASISAALAKLYATRDATAAQRDVAEAHRDTLAAAHDAAVAELRATTDGLALSMRAIEVAMLRKQAPAVLRRLRRAHQIAEDASADEYHVRLNAWGYRPGDGPARGIPVGDAPVRAALLRDGVVGYYRHDSNIAQVRVTLFRTIDDTKVSSWLLVDNRAPITLSAVFAQVFNKRRTADRVTTRLHLDAALYENLCLPDTAPATA